LKNKIEQVGTERSKDTITIDFQRLFGRLLSHWWLFILCIGIALAASQFYLRYVTFQYSARAILLIKDAGSSGKISEQSILVSDVLDGGGKAMDNEIQILKSLTMMEKVAARLELNVAYFRQGTFKEAELYQDSPFLLDSFSFPENNIFGSTFYLEIQDYKKFNLRTSADQDSAAVFYYGLPFEINGGKYSISLNPDVAVIPGDYRLRIFPLEAIASRYKTSLVVNRIGDQAASSVLELSMLDAVPEKARDVLNTLIDVYNEEEIKDENKVLRNTLQFIDKRVISLVNELDSVEGGIQRYKSANEIISSDAASSMNYTIGEIRSAVQQVSDIEIQKNMLESLENFMDQGEDRYDLIPANLIEKTPVLGGLVNQYNDLVLKNNQLAVTASEKNPSRIAIREQMIDVRALIVQTIKNLQKDIQIPLAEIEKNIEQLRGRMSSIPGLEKRLLEKIRTQAVKENLFLYLLQKREETALTEAVTTAKTRTIDAARASLFPVYPKRKMIRTFSIVIGLLVPLFLIFIRSLFETKIDSEEELKRLSTIPILGRVPLNKGDDRIIVKPGSRSAINEMFRLLRTNLNFINHGKDKQSILITSSISGEGKTFIALNLGITLALANKKVVLLGLDLRKPKLGAYLGTDDSDKGITNYLVGQNNLDDILQTYSKAPNLSYLVSGPAPPNPAELILSDKMQELLAELKERFDYILIDTPPVGLVSDALLLREYVDNLLVVVRHKYTRKVMVRNLQSMYEKDELKNASLIFNGVKQGRSYYGYGGYSYGYNESYYVEE